MFFTVKRTLRIGGKVYTPCICYPLPHILEYTVQELEKKGETVIHNEMVFFQNGKIIPSLAERQAAEKAEKKAKKEAEKKAKEAKKAEVSEETDKSVEDF